MAAAEYYFGTQNQNRPTAPYPPQQQPQQQLPWQQQPPPAQNTQLQPYNTPPPSYSPHPPQQPPQQPYQQPRPSGYGSPTPQSPYPQNGRPPTSTPNPPYPHSPQFGPQQQYPPLPQQQSGYQQNGFLGAPLMPQRSHSQPPRVHFADKNEYESDASDRSYDSDSDASRRRHRRHRDRDGHRSHSHSHSHHRDRDYDDREYDDRSYDDRDSRHRSHSHSHQKTHKDRDTFLGAGAGGIIGDAIFPGLGTAAGLLLGGYGGRSHAKKKGRSRSEAAADRDGYREYERGRHGTSQGWDADSATFRKGHAVR